MLFVVVMVGDDAGVDGICLSVCEYVCLCESVYACASRKKKQGKRKEGEEGHNLTNVLFSS